MFPSMGERGLITQEEFLGCEHSLGKLIGLIDLWDSWKNELMIISIYDWY